MVPLKKEKASHPHTSMRRPPAPSFDFAVVGAGRMGASIAGHLALQGASVALFDRSDFDRYGVSLQGAAGAPAG